MSSAIIYLDESGDTGWKFELPYRNGGSSRYLTIAALIAPSEKRIPPQTDDKKALFKTFMGYTSRKKMVRDGF